TCGKGQVACVFEFRRAIIRVRKVGFFQRSRLLVIEPGDFRVAHTQATRSALEARVVLVGKLEIAPEENIVGVIASHPLANPHSFLVMREGGRGILHQDVHKSDLSVRGGKEELNVGIVRGLPRSLADVFQRLETKLEASWYIDGSPRQRDVKR